MNPIQFEKILIKLLFTDKDVREKLVPFLTLDIFSDKNHISMMKEIFDYYKKYDKFPSLVEIKLKVLDKENLQIVLSTLQSLRQENRVVGLISHVEELQQEMDVFLKVENDPVRGTMIKESWRN